MKARKLDAPIDRETAGERLRHLSTDDLGWLKGAVTKLLATGSLDGSRRKRTKRLHRDYYVNTPGGFDDGPNHADDLMLIGMDMEDAGLDR